MKAQVGTFNREKALDGAFGLIRDCETDGSFAALLTSTEQASGSVVMGTIIQVEGWKLYVKFIFLILSYLIRWNIMLCHD